MIWEINETELRRAACNVSSAIILEAEESEYMNHVFSSEFKRKMEILLIKSRRHTGSLLILKRVAIIILALGIGFGSVMIFSEEARAAVWEWCKRVYEDKIEYQFNVDEKSEDISSITIDYVPEGFAETERIEDKEVGSYFIVYSSQNGESGFFVSVDKMDSMDEIGIYNETGEYEQVWIGDIIGEYYDKTDSSETSNLIWLDNARNIVFSIDGILPKDEMIKVANSIIVE